MPLPLGEVAERSEDGEGIPGCKNPLSRLRRQLSQRESQGAAPWREEWSVSADTLHSLFYASSIFPAILLSSSALAKYMVS